MAMALANGMKRCSKSDCPKPMKPANLDNFYSNAKTADKLSYQCKDCARGYSRPAKQIESPPERQARGRRVAPLLSVTPPTEAAPSATPLMRVVPSNNRMTVEEAEQGIRFLLAKLREAEEHSVESVKPELDKRDRAIDSMGAQISQLTEEAEALRRKVELANLEIDGFTKRLEEQDELIESADDEIRELTQKLTLANQKLDLAEQKLRQLEEPPVQFIEENLSQELLKLGFKGSK